MIRAAVVVVALTLGVAAVPVVGAGNRISDRITCKDLSKARAGDLNATDPEPGVDCFAGSIERRAIVAGLLILSGAVAALAMLAGGIAAIRNKLGIPMLLLAVVAAALFFGAYAAARV